MSANWASEPGGNAGSPIRHLPFRRFLGARGCMTIAYQMQAVAVGWEVYEISGSALALGFVGLAQFLPRVLLALIAGHVADRYDRRAVLRICLSIDILASLGLALRSFTGGLGESLIFLLVMVIGVTRTFLMPTAQALLPRLIPRSILPPAVALNASVTQTAIIIGPAFGGLIFIAGAPWVYLLCACLSLTANLLVRGIRYESEPIRREAVSTDSILAGVRFIWNRPVILGALSLDLFAVLLGGATALLPIYARDILHVGSWGLGVLRSSPALGALAVSLWLARHPLKRKIGPKMLGAVSLFGVATIVFALSTSFPLSIGALFVLGGADMISVVVRSSVVQLETPDAMRGRVSAVNTIFIGASNELGEFESGATASLFGTVPATVIGGVGTLVVVLLALRIFPQLAQRDRL